MFIFLLQLPSEYIFMKIVLIFIVTIGPYVFTYVHRLGSKFRIWIRKLFMERSDSKYFRVSGLFAAAAAAKSLQSCPTLCDPIDGSPPGSPVPGILQARTLEWVAISFSNA